MTNDRFQVVDNVGDRFLILTNKNAPNARVALYDPGQSEDPESAWKDLVPETTDTLSSASTQGGKLFVTYTRDVTSHPYVYSLDGKMENADRRCLDQEPRADLEEGARIQMPFTLTLRSTIPAQFFVTTLPAENPPSFANRRSKASRRKTMRPGRSSTPAKTAPGCPCFWFSSED